MGEAVGVGFQDEGAHEGGAHGFEAAFGVGVKGAGGAVGEGEGPEEGSEVASVGRGDVGLVVEVAVEDGGGGGLAADDGGVDALAGEGVDEAGGVADEEDAAAWDVVVASHAELLAGDVGEGGDAEFLVSVIEEQGAGNLL